MKVLYKASSFPPFSLQQLWAAGLGLFNVEFGCGLGLHVLAGIGYQHLLHTKVLSSSS